MNRQDRRAMSRKKTKEFRKIAVRAGARGPDIKRVVRTLKDRMKEGG